MFNSKQVWCLIQVNYQTKKLYMIAIILKYKKRYFDNKILYTL